MDRGCGADTSGGGGVPVGNEANGGSVVRGIDADNAANAVSDAAGVGAGNKTNGGVGSDVASFSFVPKTNSSLALPSGLRSSVLRSTLP